MNENIFNFIFFMALRSVSNIVCSYGFTVCINHDQNIVSFGTSDFGGHGHKEYQIKEWTEIDALKDKHIIKIRVGFDHSYF